MPHKILIVDQDHDAVIDALRISLREAGFEVIAAGTGAVGLAKAQAEKPSLIVLDLTLPQISGLELCLRLKKGVSTSHIPIIILTAKAAEEDRVIGFEVGADDYVTKPFSPREMTLRIKNSIRRNVELEKLPIWEKMTLGDLVLDHMRHEVTIHNKLVSLSFIEFRLLARLMGRCGYVVERGTLLDEVWGLNSNTATRAIDTHVVRLRIKLGSLARHLETVRGVGYRLSESISLSSKERDLRQPNLNVVNLPSERLDNRKVIPSRAKKRHASLAMSLA